MLFDSDDEPEYLSKAVASTVEQFSGLHEEELDRRLLGAGLPIGVGDERLEELYQRLTEEEKKKFTELADDIFRDEMQAQTNCFVKRKAK